jgi:hypothetical protein
MSQGTGVVGTRSARPTGYVRPTWQEAVGEYLPPRWRGVRSRVWIGRLPMVAVVVVTVAMSARLSNTAFIDEAHTIAVGRDLLLQWFAGGPAVNSGPAPSGVPGLYPVGAAALDAVGGLRLARLFSLVCVVVAVVALGSAAARATASNRIGLLTAYAFALTAPVVFVGSLATPDAACLALLAVAVRTGVANRSSVSAAITGALVALAAAVGYVAVLFAPAVLLTTLLVPPGEVPVRRRPAIALAVAAGLLGGLYLAAGSQIRVGIATAAASLVTPVAGQSSGTLGAEAALDMGLLLVLAVAGAVQAVRTGTVGRAAAACGLLIGGVAVPVVQLTTGGATSFNQHNAYAALLLAPLAGYALTVLSRQLFRAAPVVVILVLALLPEFSRSDALFHQWSDVTVVMSDIQAHPQPGVYLSVASDVFAYHSRDTVTGVRWEATSTLYAQGTAAVRAAVAERRYQVIVLRSVSTASPGQDVLVAALALSADYEKDPLVQPTGPARDQWLVYRLVNTLP